jgi:predicted Ser/Thr protein kinase
MRMKIKRIKRIRTEIEKQKTKKTNRALFLVGEREKNDHQQQFDHHISLCTTLGGRGYNDTSSDMVEC